MQINIQTIGNLVQLGNLPQMQIATTQPAASQTKTPDKACGNIEAAPDTSAKDFTAVLQTAQNPAKEQTHQSTQPHQAQNHQPATKLVSAELPQAQTARPNLSGRENKKSRDISAGQAEQINSATDTISNLLLAVPVANQNNTLNSPVGNKTIKGVAPALPMILQRAGTQILPVASNALQKKSPNQADAARKVVHGSTEKSIRNSAENPPAAYQSPASTQIKAENSGAVQQAVIQNKTAADAAVQPKIDLAKIYARPVQQTVKAQTVKTDKEQVISQALQTSAYTSAQTGNNAIQTSPQQIPQAADNQNVKPSVHNMHRESAAGRLKNNQNAVNNSQTPKSAVFNAYSAESANADIKNVFQDKKLISGSENQPAVRQMHPPEFSALSPQQITKPTQNAAEHKIGIQISDAVGAAVNENKDEITVRLNPPELGKVTIKLSQQDNEITGVIQVDRAATRYEIEKSIPRIMENLGESGLHVKKIEVALSGNTENNLRQSPEFSDGRQNTGQGQFEQQSQHNAYSGTVPENPRQTIQYEYPRHTEQTSNIYGTASVNVLV